MTGRIIQLAAVLCVAADFRHLAQNSWLMDRDGVDISWHASKVHGFTNAIIDRGHPLPQEQAFQAFTGMVNAHCAADAKVALVAHNGFGTDFKWLHYGLKRVNLEMPPQVCAPGECCVVCWASVLCCTRLLTRPLRMNILACVCQVVYTLDTLRLCQYLRKRRLVPQLRSGRGALKNATLYQQATGHALVNAHDALADCQATLAILKWDALRPHANLRLMRWYAVVQDEELRVRLQQQQRKQQRDAYLVQDGIPIFDVEAEDVVDRDEVTDWQVVREECGHTREFHIRAGLPRRCTEVATEAGAFKYLFDGPVRRDAAHVKPGEAVTTTALEFITHHTNLQARLCRAAPVIKRFLRWFAWKRHGQRCDAPMRYVIEKTGPGAWKLEDKRPKPRAWKPVTKREMLAFFMIPLMQSVRAARGKCRELQLKDDPVHLQPGSWRAILPQVRYEQIWRYLHISDLRFQPFTKDKAKEQAKEHRLYKVAAFIDVLQARWRFCFTCGRYVSVDESMIDFDGRCGFKTVMKCKHFDIGFKVWMLNDSDTYYCYGTDIKSTMWDSDAGIFEGTDVVVRLIKRAGLEKANRVVVADNYFVSVQLASMLQKLGTYILGVLRESRVPAAAKMTKAGHKRGDIQVAYSKSTDMAIVAWFDSRIVYFLTSKTASPAVVGQVERWDKRRRQKLQVDAPSTSKEYGMNMNGADGTDAQLNLCSLAAAVGRNNKWWHRILLHQVDLTLHNARVLFQLKTGKEVSNREFRESVVSGVYQDLTRPKPQRQPPPGCKRRVTDDWVKGGNGQRVRKRRLCLVCATGANGKMSTAKKRCTGVCAAHGPMHIVPVGDNDESCFDMFHADVDVYLRQHEARAKRQRVAFTPRS